MEKFTTFMEDSSEGFPVSLLRIMQEEPFHGGFGVGLVV
jgi:hypothetical protein